MERWGRGLLVGLGALLLWSSAEHLFGATGLDAHYTDAALPGVNRWSVGALQGLGGVALLPRRRQRAAALVVLTVMSAVVLLALGRGRMSGGTAQALGLALWAGLGLALTRGTGNATARSTTS
jgi:hypothetical protein